MIQESISHNFAKCPSVEPFWGWVEKVAYNLKIEMYPRPEIPEGWTRIAGVRDYNINHKQADEQRWQVIHAIAIQTVNANHWANRGSKFILESMQAQFR